MLYILLGYEMDSIRSYTQTNALVHEMTMHELAEKTQLSKLDSKNQIKMPSEIEQMKRLK